MKIKLKLNLPQQLKDVGLSPGTIIRDAEPMPMSEDGTLRFYVLVDGDYQIVTVSRENYVLL